MTNSNQMCHDSHSVRGEHYRGRLHPNPMEWNPGYRSFLPPLCTFMAFELPNLAW